MKYGIDVCSYQGNIDWKKVKGEGCQFAVLKCIRKNLNPDTAFSHNVAGCAAQNIPAGVYTYVYEGDVKGAKKRAQAAVKACQERGLEGITIWWDVEDECLRKVASNRNKKAALLESIRAAKKVIESAGYGFGVYCDMDFRFACLDNGETLNVRFWIAAYHGNPVTTLGQAPKYKKPVIANELCGWQFCSKGRVPGIFGSVDLNIAYDDDFTSFSKPVKQEQKEKQVSKTGNPYPVPAITVTSEKRAKQKGLTSYLSSGEEVKYVQWELWRLGYDVGAVDGQAGEKTVAAIEAFQHDEFLTVDGLAGPLTVAKLVVTKSIDYKPEVVKGAKTAYPLCIGKVHGGPISKKVVSLATLKKYNALSCNRMVSISMQIAGLLAVGVVVSHTPKAAGKKTIGDAATGWQYLRHCKLVWVNKKYSDLPAEYKKPGCVYYQNSNACVNMGNGHIFSCNKDKNYRYKRKSDYDRTFGCPHTSNILFVVVPLTPRA